jgi:excinuclease UvrABC ATPase subunit
LANLSVRDSIKFFSEVKLNQTEEKIAKNIFKNIVERLEFLS